MNVTMNAGSPFLILFGSYQVFKTLLKYLNYDKCCWLSHRCLFSSQICISLNFLHINHNVILTPTISKSPVQYQVHPHSPPPPLNTTTTHQQPQLPTTMEVSAMLLCTSPVIHVRTSMWQEILWLINKSCGRKKLKQPKPQPSLVADKHSAEKKTATTSCHNMQKTKPQPSL